MIKMETDVHKNNIQDGALSLRALFILSQTSVDFFCPPTNNIDLAIIPASCTDEIQLMDVVVNGKFKHTMYFQWANWIMYGPQKTQAKSDNYVPVNFLDILSWLSKAWESVKKETILNGVEKCYMSAEPGEKFDVEPAPEEMKVEKEKKEKKKIKVAKSKSEAELIRFAAKMKRKKMKLLREQRKAQAKADPKKKSTPKKKNARKSPIKCVKRRKTIRKRRQKRK